MRRRDAPAVAIFAGFMETPAARGPRGIARPTSGARPRGALLDRAEEDSGRARARPLCRQRRRRDRGRLPRRRAARCSSRRTRAFSGRTSRSFHPADGRSAVLEDDTGRALLLSPPEACGFDLVVADPPTGRSARGTARRRPRDVLTPEGILVLQRDRFEALPDLPGFFSSSGARTAATSSSSTPATPPRRFLAGRRPDPL